MIPPADGRRTEIFSQINLADFPVLSENSQALKVLTRDPDASLADLVQVVARDYGMVIKMLREANVDFYTQNRPVISIPAAVGRIGFEAAADRVSTIPFLEDAVRLGGEEAVLPLITRSFLSALLSRELCAAKKLCIAAEEAYVCALFHHLGEALALLFFPDSHRKIVKLQESGAAEDQAVSTVFFGLTYPRLGMDVARFWNFPAPVVSCMDPEPAPPKGSSDPEGILHNAVCFCNQLVDAVSEGAPTNILLDRYGDFFSLNKEEALQLLESAVAKTRSFTACYRQTLLKMKLGGKLRRLEMLMPGSIRPKIFKEGGRGPDDAKGDGETAGIRPDPISQFFQDVNRALNEAFDFRNFITILLAALHKGIGFDRVVLTSLVLGPDDMYLQGRFGVGDILPQEIAAFRHSLSNPQEMVTRSLTNREDISMVVSRHSDFPRHIEEIFHGRFLSLLPLCMDDRPLGVLFLDRKAGRLPPNERQLKAAAACRDIMIVGIRKDMRAFDPELC